MPTSARASRRNPGLTASGSDDIDNVAISIPTRSTPTGRRSGALRGFGVPQLVWAYEGHTDMMARALNIEPVEFRRKNIVHEGGPHATGQIFGATLRSRR